MYRLSLGVVLSVLESSHTTVRRTEFKVPRTNFFLKHVSWIISPILTHILNQILIAVDSMMCPH